ncbi:MAG: hypothetical protein JO235_17915 [Chroococcidiopsidaceae cyanobacterium CP_BM_RX_35]|nr:hypothetical protein [Chroococcidiopsidaceae cyanobacterium CP_BM_RX_35]
MSAKSLTQLVIGTSVGMFLFSSVALPVKAEPAAPTPASVDPLQDFRNPDRSSDPFARSNQGDNFGVMDLLRNAIKNSNRGTDGFSAGDQDTNLNSATDQFRAKQQQLLRQQTPSAPSSATKPY